MAQSERFELLWADFLEGRLGPEGMAELQAMLEADAGLGKRAVDDYRMHRLLGRVLVPERPEAFVRSTMGALRRDREGFVRGVVSRLRVLSGHWIHDGRSMPPLVWVRYATVAAVALFAGVCLQRRGLGPDAAWARDTTVALSPPVATLLFADRCAWGSGGMRPIEGQRLASGPLRMGKGTALLRFDGGAVVILDGDVDIELETRGSARLRYGRVVVRAEGEASGFTVRTPVGQMIDLGTEFSVRVERCGTTELDVIEGEVEHLDAARESRRFEAGQGIRLDKDGAPIAREAARRPIDFADLLNRVRPPTEHEPMAYEGFNYPLRGVAEADAGGGYGWAGPWRLRQGEEVSRSDFDGPAGMVVVERDFDAPWLPAIRGTMLRAPGGGFFRIRPMAEPIDLGSDRVYFVSFLTRGDISASPPERDSGFRVTLRDSSRYWGNCVSFGEGGDRRPRVDLGDGVRFVAAERLTGGSLQFWVAKIAARRRGEDEIFVRIYDPGAEIDAAEPAAWDLASRGVDSAARLDLLLLTNDGGAVRWVDEIRVGKTWWAAVPIAQPLKTLATRSKGERP